MPKFKKARELKLNTTVMGLAWSPDGSRLATLEGMNQLVEVWDTATGNLVSKIKKEPAGSTKILFTSDGKCLIIPLLNSDTTALNIVDIDTGQSVRAIDGPNLPHANEPSDYLLSPDGKRLYVTFYVEPIVVHIFDTSTWAHLGVLPDSALVMSAGPANDEITTVEPSGKLRVWNTSTATIVRTFDLATPCYAIALAPAACLLASGSLFSATPVRLWSLNSGQPLSQTLVRQQIRALSFSPDARVLAVASGLDRSAVLLATNDLAAGKTLVRFDNDVATVSFSPDGKYLGAAGDEKVVLFEAQ